MRFGSLPTRSCCSFGSVFRSFFEQEEVFFHGKGAGAQVAAAAERGVVGLHVLHSPVFAEQVEHFRQGDETF